MSDVLALMLASMITPSPRKADRPIFWIIAGPNGCGKSSLYNRTDIEGWGGSVWIVNPDLLTQKIIEDEGSIGDAANLAAVERIEEWLKHSIEVYQTIGVETVLSTPKYRALMEHAHKRGFEVRMIYVLLKHAELQLERIRLRVSEGGHDVPEDKVRSRRQRSLEQLAWFAPKVDELWIYDNSTGKPELIGSKKSDMIIRIRSWPKDLAEAFSAADVKIGHLGDPDSWKLL
ncbi:MAG: zeta toxin family protein [Sphingopyxis sp.]